MKTVYWDDDNIPPIIVLPDERVQVFDYPYWDGFEVGDQIVYMTEIGPSCYRVVDVQPEHDIDPDFQEMRRVTIEGV